MTSPQPPMHPTEQETADRLTELEIKTAFNDDLLDRLNELIYRQQVQIDRLTEEVAQLRHRQHDNAAPEFRSLRDELPPHY